MNWFDKIKKGIKTRIKRGIPEDIWIKCDGCENTIYRKDLEKGFWVCPQCNYHFQAGHEVYVELLMDEGSFEDINSEVGSADPLKFKDNKRYTDRIKDGREKTGLKAAVRTGIGTIEGNKTALGVLEQRFIMGSLDSAMGEKLARLIDRAKVEKIPLIIVCQSGGARMQESALALMQMAKVCAKLHQLSDEGIPYISLLTNPTTGGVSASFGMLGDIIIAEPKSLIGFAGPRVIMQSLNIEELPEGFQLSESVLEHGFLDMIVHRGKMKDTIAKLIEFFDQDNSGT